MTNDACYHLKYRETTPFVVVVVVDDDDDDMIYNNSQKDSIWV